MRIWFVDAFAERPFAGNTAAVIPVEAWPPDEWMRAIAAQNRVSETAFIQTTGARGDWRLRWFTPAMEVPLCGHATLAAGAVALTELEPELDVAVFETLSGSLIVRKHKHSFSLDLPRRPRLRWTPPEALLAALGDLRPFDAFQGEYATLVLGLEEQVRAFKPNMQAIGQIGGARPGCLAITAPAAPESPYDFVCRFFAPGVGIDEDPVTGSSFADLAPYWCERLGQESVLGLQASARGGLVRGAPTLGGARLVGEAIVYLRGVLGEAMLPLPQLAPPQVKSQTIQVFDLGG